MKGRAYVPKPVMDDAEAKEEYRKAFLATAGAFFSESPVLVNAQGVMDDLCPPDESMGAEEWRRVLNYREVPRPLPPFPLIWLEARLQPQRANQHVGILVRRYRFDDYRNSRPWRTFSLSSEIDEENPKWIIECCVFVEFEGSVKMTGTVLYWLDEEDRFLRSSRSRILDDVEENARMPLNETTMQHGSILRLS